MNSLLLNEDIIKKLRELAGTALDVNEKETQDYKIICLTRSLTSSNILITRTSCIKYDITGDFKRPMVIIGREGSTEGLSIVDGKIRQYNSTYGISGTPLSKKNPLYDQFLAVEELIKQL